MNPLNSYDEWLALSESERERIKLAWNAYEREAIGYPLIAGGRLALSSDTRILDVHVGTYHGGEYLIHAVVSDDDLPNMPKPLTTSFEGFRIIYLKR